MYVCKGGGGGRLQYQPPVGRRGEGPLEREPNGNLATIASSVCKLGKEG